MKTPKSISLLGQGGTMQTLEEEDDEEEEDAAMMCQFHCSTHGAELK